MARRIEQGSVLGFVLVGAVLVGLLAGSVYVVRRMQATDTTTTTKPVTSNKDTADSGSSAPAKPSTLSDDDKLKAALDSQSKGDTKKPGTSRTSSSSANTSDSTSTAAALPKTGPEHVVFSTLGAALLVASVVSYTRSRRLI